MPKGKPKRLYPQLYKRGKYIGWEKKLAITRTPAPEPLPPVVHKGNLAALCKTLNEYLDKVKPSELAAMLSKDPMDQWRGGLISDVEAMTKLTASVTEVIASMRAQASIPAQIEAAELCAALDKMAQRFGARFIPDQQKVAAYVAAKKRSSD